MRALTLIAMSLLFADGGQRDAGAQDNPLGEVVDDTCKVDADCVYVSGSNDCCFPCGGRAISRAAAEEQKQRCAGVKCPDRAYGCAAPPDTRLGVMCREGHCALRPRPSR